MNKLIVKTREKILIKTSGDEEKKIRDQGKLSGGDEEKMIRDQGKLSGGDEAPTLRLYCPFKLMAVGGPEAEEVMRQFLERQKLKTPPKGSIKSSQLEHAKQPQRQFRRKQK